MTPWIFAALLLFQTNVDYKHDGKKADPADFTIPVHVQASHRAYVTLSGNGSSVLRLDVLIKGKICVATKLHQLSAESRRLQSQNSEG